MKFNVCRLAVLAAVTVVLSGCGGSSPGASPVSSGPVSSGPFLIDAHDVASCFNRDHRDPRAEGGYVSDGYFRPVHVGPPGEALPYAGYADFLDFTVTLHDPNASLGLGPTVTATVITFPSVQDRKDYERKFNRTTKLASFTYANENEFLVVWNDENANDGNGVDWALADRVSRVVDSCL